MPIRAGATLAEVILAFGLLAILLLIASQLALVALRGNTKSIEDLTAESLAQDSCQRFVYDLPEASSGFWTLPSFPSPYLQDSLDLGQQRYVRHLYLSDLNAVQPGLRLVRVRVAWGDALVGRPRTGQGYQMVEVTRLVSPP